MTKKQALRDLQFRLADRLQSAQGQAVSVAWLAVTLAGQNYLLPLSQSGEIFPLPSMARVPHTQPWFCGVANLRGGLFGVVDLALLLTAHVGAVRSEPASAQARLVTFNALSGANCALRVDALLGLRKPASFVSSSPPAANAPHWLTQRFLDAQNNPWQEIDLYALSQTPAFLAIGA